MTGPLHRQRGPAWLAARTEDPPRARGLRDPSYPVEAVHSAVGVCACEGR